MTTERLSHNTKLMRALLQQQAPRLDSFMLLDVGCSGGLHPLFYQFKDRLKAVGFDPVIAEVERLKAGNNNPNITFEAAFVGAEGYEKLFPLEARSDPRSTDFFNRTSAARAQQMLQAQQQANDSVPSSLMATAKTSLDHYCASKGITKVDFVKIDTDGSDYEVLTGAEKLLSRGVVGASIECQLHGAVHPHANVFSNIDRFMRERGFALFDLDVHRYARNVLPLPFAKDMSAQTYDGAVSWAEAVYFRDLADVDYEKKWKIDVTPEDVLKLACLYDLYGLVDCAAELILKRPEAFQSELRETYLDLLVPPMIMGTLNYREFNGVFDLHPEFWYPSNKLFGQK